MSIKKLTVLFLLLTINQIFAQKNEIEINKEHKRFNIFKPQQIGVLYNKAAEDNFLFNDSDYTYETNVIKCQFFYDLYTPNSTWNLNLIIQPQFQLIQHQLLNLHFVTPETPNYVALRERYLKEKSMLLYAFEIGFQIRKPIIKKLFGEVILGLGGGYIDTETERLASGFTFIENISAGLAYNFDNVEIYGGVQIGHISNFNIQMPNSGYNVLGFEIGFRYGL